LLLVSEHFGTVQSGTAHSGIDLVNSFTRGTRHNVFDLVNSGITPSTDFVKKTFAGNDGEMIPALCMSFQAIKQFDDKLSTTRASIEKCFPLSIWMSNKTFPTHPNDELFAVIMGSFPHVLYFIFALSNKRS
jgi:hypothetical protein